jgi:hypothetical protein
MNIFPAFLGALCVVLGLAMLGNRAGYFYLVIRPRSLVTLAVIATAGVLFLTRARAGEEQSQAHIPCGLYSDAKAAKKLIPPNHITYCFGAPMKRDEAIARAQQLAR